MPDPNELYNIDIDPDAAAAELCRRPGGFFFFVQEFWEVIIHEEPVWNWHIEYLCGVAEEIIWRLKARLPKEEDVIVNIPPGTSKSTLWSIMLDAWAWGIDPTLKILSLSYSDEVAMDFSVKCRDIIQSDKYRRWFPYVRIRKDQNNKTHFVNTLGGMRYSAGIGGSITGKHFHLLKMDDPLNPKEAASEVECASTCKTIDSTLPTRKIDKLISVTITIMQRLSENDPTGHQLSKKGKRIRHICLPAEIKDGVKPRSLEVYYKDGLLDPVRLSQPVLDEALVDLGAANYAGQFGQRPAPAGGLIWQRWFMVVPDEHWPDTKYMTQFGTDWDLAYTKDDDNAASAYISAGKIGNKIYIDDFDWKWLEFPAMVRYMKTKPSPHYIEAKASGKSAKQTLTMQGVPAIEIPVSGGDKIARANMATPYAESGMVYVRKSMIERLYSDAKQGILNFPRGKFKDLADVLAQCLQRLGKKGTLSVTSGREKDKNDDYDNDDY